MKSYVLIIIGAIILSVRTFAQFEEPKLTNDDSLRVRVGADFAMQYQGLKHHADSTLIKLGMGLNLPTANLKIEGYLARGIKVNLQVYLSSRHHTDTWVKGGYLLIDRLDFMNSEFINKIMDHLTIKVGVTDLDFGDSHFRRSDNGNVINNPYVGNYVMDAFTTAPNIELTYRNSGWIIMLATTSGNLDPILASYTASTKTYSALNTSYELAYYGKVGFDKQLNDALRVRLTLSGYFGSHNDHNGSLYYGDRAGSRYYLVMNRTTNNATDVDPATSPTSGYWGPGFHYKDNSIMGNLYVKLKGLEVFGTIENANGIPASKTGSYTFSQYVGEARYLFGKKEQFYGGGRYDYVKGKVNTVESSVGRFQAALGWYLTKNIVTKLEYVKQNYNDFALYGSHAGFKGVMIEAGISF